MWTCGLEKTFFQRRRLRNWTPLNMMRISETSFKHMGDVRATMHVIHVKTRIFCIALSGPNSLEFQMDFGWPLY